MKAVEQFSVPEPEWILDRCGSGPLHWRRESPQSNSRVKFLYDVEIKEFHRGDHELEEAEWPTIENSGNFVTGLTCALCLVITMVLPWYIFIGPSS